MYFKISIFVCITESSEEYPDPNEDYNLNDNFIMAQRLRNGKSSQKIYGKKFKDYPISGKD